MGSQKIAVGELGKQSGNSALLAEEDLNDLSNKGTEEIRVIQWEEFTDSLAHLCGLASIDSKLRAKKEDLVLKLEAALEVRKASLQRIDELEAMKRRLQCRKNSLDTARSLCLQKSQQVVVAKEKLLPSARSLLVSAHALAAAQSRLLEADRLLAGEGGYGCLMQLRKMLSARQQIMVMQVAALYPLAPCRPTHSFSVHNNDPANLRPHFSAVEKLDSIPMTIAGLHVLVPLNKNPGLYNEKKDYEASATALGYVAHVVLLVASYLDVPLRYPINLGASRSYIQDCASLIEPVTAETRVQVAVVSQGGARKHATEFPLFSEGQDPTRSAYAFFLLNKDLEQMLNYFGAESVGPRHILPNLNRLIQLICSGAHNIT
eukprot:c19602_g1_i2 orf=443-1567(-)